MPLRSKVVAGAGKGIGAAIAVLFSRYNAPVYAAEVDESGGRGVVEEIRAANREAPFLVLDVTDDVRSSASMFGRLPALTALLTAAFLLTVPPASAHDIPVSHLHLLPGPEYVHLELVMNPFELQFFRELDTNHDHRLDRAELDGRGEHVARRILDYLHVRIGSDTLSAVVAGVTADSDHHVRLRAHYRADARRQHVIVASRLAALTSGSHVTEVSFGRGAAIQRARLHGRSATARFEPAPSPQQTLPAGTVWSIGTIDGLPMEFAPGARDSVLYRVGADSPSEAFPEYQYGKPLDTPGGRASNYTVAFDLDEPPTAPHRLILELIYKTGSPKRIEVHVNGRRGIFPVRRSPKEDLNSEQADRMLLTRQRLEVPVPPDWLARGENRIAIIPLGVSRMAYDAVVFEQSAFPQTPPRLVPTMLYTGPESALEEIVELDVPFAAPFADGRAIVEVGDFTVDVALDRRGYDFGVVTERVAIPALEAPSVAALSVSLDGEERQHSHEHRPARRWKLYITPKVHNDVGFTDLQPNVNELDTRNTDTVLEILERYPYYIFNFETSWLVDNYVRSRPPEYGHELLHRAAEGRAPVNAFYLNLLTGLTSGEELYRAMYFSHRLHREHDIPFNWACLTDAPSHTWFIPTLLQDVGIKTFSVGSNQGRAPILRFSDMNENSPFYWEGMNGERILKWYARSYLQLHRLTGLWQWTWGHGFEYMKSSVPQFLVRYDRSDYVPDAVMLYGAYLDNATIPVTGEAPLIEEWNATYAYPRLVVSSDTDYFDYIEEHFEDRLPVYRGGAGAYWEDGAASTARATTTNQHTQELLPVAETAAAFSSLLDPRYLYPADRFEEAWRNVMFYDEHTWGAHNAATQPDRLFVDQQWEIKRDYALSANLEARTLLTRSLNRLVQQVAYDGDTFFAFNFQPWPRTAVLEAEIGESQYILDPDTETALPFEVLFEKDGFRRVRFVVENVPPMGYTGYAVRSFIEDAGGGPAREHENVTGPMLDAAPEDVGAREALAGETIESPYYRLTVDPASGSLVSLYDKTEGRELVDAAAPYGLNEYLYVSGGEDSEILNHGQGVPPAHLTVHEPRSGRVVEAFRTALGERIRVRAEAEMTPVVETEYMLYNDLKRVDVVNRLEKERTVAKEAAYFAFPFAAADPAPSYQIQNGWLRPNEDQLPGAAREWFTTQNLVRVDDGDFTVAWASPDAPLFTLTDINRGEWPTHLAIENGHVYSYVMNNYWFTNYRSHQSGSFTFRYSITSGSGLDREALARFDTDLRSPVFGYPMIATFGAVTPQPDKALDRRGASLADLDADNLQFVVMKAAEDGDGTIIRLLETAGRDGNATLDLPVLNVSEAFLCNGVEEILQPLEVSGSSVTVPYRGNRYVTIRLRAKGGL